MTRLLVLISVFGTLAISQTRPQVESVEFFGQVAFSDELLRSVIRTQEPSAFWRWMHDHLSERLGDPPILLDEAEVDADAVSLRLFYENQGFYKANVRPVIEHLDGGVEVQFWITEGERSSVESVELRGIDSLTPDIQSALRDDPLIKPGDPFVIQTAEAEFRRLITIFSNSGYVGVEAIRKTAMGNEDSTSYSLLFEFKPGPLHEFGDVEVVQDTLSREQIENDIILRHLDFKTGETYSEAKKAESERLLNRLGVFDASRVEIGGRQAAGDRIRVPMRVAVRTRAFQELTPEIGISGEYGGTNALVGLGYSHRNFLGGARNFSALFRFSVRSVELSRIGRIFSSASLTDSTLVTRTEFSLQLTQPYLFSNKISLTSTLSGILDKQKTYYVPIFRGKLGILTQPTLANRFVADLNLEWIDPTSVTTSADTILKGRFEPQFNSILTLTLQRDKRNDIFSPTEGNVYTAIFEEAGILPSLYESIGGKPLPFAQYVKFVFLGQWFTDPGAPGGVVWAAKILGGSAHLYEPSTADVPVTRTFYGGGSGSVRGWKARELGSLRGPTDQGGKAIFEASVEARLSPFRTSGSFLFLDPRKIAFAVFADAGNVWEEQRFMRLDEIAIAAGFGIRYNTVAGPIRIDFGMKVFDPLAEPPPRRWVTNKRFWKETFAGGVIHLGIGHPF